MKYYKSILSVALFSLLLLACGEKSTADKAEQIDTTQAPQPTTEATPQSQTPAPQPEVKEAQKPAKKPTVLAEGPKVVEKPVDEQRTKPQKFIATSGVSFESRGLTSSLFDLHFTVTNKSKYSYKNMKFRVDFYDEDATLISSQNITCDEVVGAGQTQTITKGVNKVKGTETVKMRCTGAKVAN